jgi:hypothetical protein
MTKENDPDLYRDDLYRLKQLERRLKNLCLSIHEMEDERQETIEDIEVLETFLAVNMDPEDFRDELGFYPEDAYPERLH